MRNVLGKDIEYPVVINHITGEVVATGVSEEEYMERYAEHHCEWVGGVVIKMSPIHERHYLIVSYLADLFKAFLALRPIARIREDPFVMRLPNLTVGRQPDIQVILNTNPHELKETYMDGPADICVEVISPGSVARDRGDKFEEYEKGGVREYWLVDTIRDEALFYRLSAEGFYTPHAPDNSGVYKTPLLPGLCVHVPTLWQEKLPDYFSIGQAVRAMLGEGG